MRATRHLGRFAKELGPSTAATASPLLYTHSRSESRMTALFVQSHDKWGYGYEDELGKKKGKTDASHHHITGQSTGQGTTEESGGTMEAIFDSGDPEPCCPWAILQPQKIYIIMEWL